MNDHLEKISFRIIRGIGTPLSIIVHTALFLGAFALVLVGYPFENVLLVLTTAVSLEAIYLAIFIQMTVNRQSEQIEEVGEDIEDIQENVEDLEEDVQEISEDVDRIQEEFVEDELEDAATYAQTKETLAKIDEALRTLTAKKERLSKRRPAARTAPRSKNALTRFVRAMHLPRRK